MPNDEALTVQAAVIGCGLTGMSAALFAGRSNVEAAVIGSSGASELSSGLIDLFGTHPGDTSRICSEPWRAIQDLPDTLPGHPYSLTRNGDIDRALTTVLSELDDHGLTYTGHEGRNAMIPGPLGTLKPTYRVPESMWPAVQGLAAQSSCLIVDFHGLKDFSAGLVAANLEPVWPGIRTARLTFPETGSRSELFTALLAQSLESPRLRQQLASKLQPLLRGVRALGLPAVLGLNDSKKVYQELTDRLQIPIFEIPTLPASVPALRLKSALRRALDSSPSIRVFDQARVARLNRGRDGWFRLTVQGAMDPFEIRCQAVLLATGRFLGQGLEADRRLIREPVLGLPVHQPETRAAWHREDFFQPEGHPVNRAGILVDKHFRPIDKHSDVMYRNVHAAGSILAEHDWTRTKSGSGVAIATAYRAMSSLCAALPG